MWADPIDTGADTLDDELQSTDAAGDDALLAASVPAPVAATDPAKAA